MTAAPGVLLAAADTFRHDYGNAAGNAARSQGGFP
jgi:hypothetical protein